MRTNADARDARRLTLVLGLWSFFGVFGASSGFARAAFMLLKLSRCFGTVHPTARAQGRFTLRLPFDLNLGGSRRPVSSVWIPAPRPRGDRPRGNDGANACHVIPAKVGIHGSGQPASR